MGYLFEMEEEFLTLLTGLISGIPTSLFRIAAYVLSSIAIYTISRRRGLCKPWLAWIPVVNCWLLGSLSDQYQYVVKGENKNKRKWLMFLSVLKAMLIISVTALGVVVVAGAIFNLSGGDMMRFIDGPLIGILGLTLPLAAVAIAFCVIRYMALYDVYRSLDPSNAVLYLVLSILFSPTEPFFLFFNREKDLGMPPRKRQPVCEQPAPEQDFSYETVEDTEYT